MAHDGLVAQGDEDEVFAPRGEEVGAVRWPDRLRKLAEVLERISFSTPPELRLNVTGDATVMVKRPRLSRD